VTDQARDLDLLLSGAKLLPGDALVRLFEQSPGLLRLLDRLERLSGQLMAAGLRHVDVPPEADSRTVRRAWLAALLRLDALANLDTARVAHLARGGTWQGTVDCPCGCGTNMKPVFHLDYRPSRN
jgi:hypothetical protein